MLVEHQNHLQELDFERRQKEREERRAAKAAAEDATIVDNGDA